MYDVPVFFETRERSENAALMVPAGDALEVVRENEVQKQVPLGRMLANMLIIRLAKEEHS
jgi:hypothetical protein